MNAYIHSDILQLFNACLFIIVITAVTVTVSKIVEGKIVQIKKTFISVLVWAERSQGGRIT